MLNEKNGEQYKNQYKVHKVDKVDFTIDQETPYRSDFNLVWKEGELYISLTNLMLTDGNKWYEVPIKELENIYLLDQKPVKIQFKLPSVDITVTGEYAERLLALKHFLMPYIHPKREQKAIDNIKNLIKFWSLTIQDIPQLSRLLTLTPEETKKLISLAKKKKLISENGEITPKAYELFSSEEKKFLQSGGK